MGRSHTVNSLCPLFGALLEIAHRVILSDYENTPTYHFCSRSARHFLRRKQRDLTPVLRRPVEPASFDVPRLTAIASNDGVLPDIGSRTLRPKVLVVFGRNDVPFREQRGGANGVHKIPCAVFGCCGSLGARNAAMGSG
jgi:hypothetical protein